MQDNEHIKDEPIKNRSNGRWKLWLGMAIFIAIVINSHIENNSPEGEANRAQLFQNSVKNSYSETLEECNSKLSQEECQEQAENAANLTRKHLGPALGQ